MKTLKKTLCLVLAMVMVFGLCAISASANLGYADTDDITYKEAVDVMSGIGILSGDARGFRPTDDITRAEAAKILAYIIVGNASQADAVKASSAPFVDVPASHWAAGYISYCAAAGVIMGKADGYHPSDKVTGLEFAVMLLRALGYGKKGEFVGSDWSINASREALRLGIFDGNYAGANTNPATREECALYAFNTITKINKVSYSELLGSYVTSSAFGGTTGTAVDANKSDKFADDFKLKNTKDETEETDDFGRIDGYYWYVNKKSNRVTNYYVDGAKLKEVYTTAVTGADIYNLLGSSAIKDAELIVCHNDDSDTAVSNSGTPAANAWHIKNFAKGKTTDLANTGNGVETYVYAWTDSDTDVNHIRIVIIDTYMVKIDKVTKATATKDRSVTVDVLGQTSEFTGISKTYETEEFEKGDYVLVTHADGKIQTMVPAEVIEDEVTRFNQNGSKKSIVVNGNTYSAAKNSVAPSDEEGAIAASAIDKAVVDGKDHKIYVDTYGYVIGIDKVTAESNYVYVAQLGLKTDDSGKLSDKKVLKADIYYADGTNEVVTVNTSYGTAPTTNKFKMSDSDLNSYSNGAADKGLYKLSWDDEKAVLVAAEDTGLSGNVTKNISAAYSTNKYDGKTVFFYVKGTYGNDLSVTVYTGINSVPKSSATGYNDTDPEAKLEQAISADGTVKAAYVLDRLEAEDGDAVYYFLGTDNTSTYSKEGTTVYYSVYAKGDQETTELELKYGNDTKTNTAINAADTEGFYYVNGSNNHLAKITSGNTKDSVTYTTGVSVTKASTDAYTLNGTLTLDGTNVVDLRDVADTVDSVAGFAELVKAATDGTVTIATAVKDGNVTDMYITAATIPAE